ncbi:type II toxin-antitoxin system ParD family antitoxin [Sphingomonas sp.]|jgi:predicted transcriptional regulator|uniref:ribbon-helix-helix domain-containing protein n=1 Tax=Sphingomonas sp. TaxID=28214 RepID=UPI0035C83037
MASAVQVNDSTEDRIDALVASARFASPEAVVAAGVERVAQDDAWLRMLDAKIAAGRADFAAGRFYTVDQVREELRNRSRAWPRSSSRQPR